jgi:hypothetical protein
MRKSFLAFAFLAFCPLLISQQVFNNESVIKLVKAGLSDDLIVSTINAAPGSYDTSADGIIALKSAGASDKVVAAVIARASPPPGQVTNPATAPDSLATGNPAAENKQYHGQIQPGSRVVVAPMGGFETYFAAAIREKRVPITLTLDRDSAQYFIVSTETEWRGFVAGSSANANWGQTSGHYSSGSSASSTRGLESSIMLIDAKSKDVVWAYEVHKSSHGALLFGTFGARGQQSLAEACAKHLKEFMEKGK